MIFNGLNKNYDLKYQSKKHKYHGFNNVWLYFDHTLLNP